MSTHKLELISNKDSNFKLCQFWIFTTDVKIINKSLSFTCYLLMANGNI